MKIKSLLSAFLLFPLLCSMSCGQEKPPKETEPSSSETLPGESGIRFADGFSLAFDPGCGDAKRTQILRIREGVMAEGGGEMPLIDATYPEDEAACEIIAGAACRAECAALTDPLGEDEYAIRAVKSGDKTKIVLAWKGDFAALCAVDRFVKEYITSGTLTVPEDLDVKGKCTGDDVLITAKGVHLRDPFLLVDDDGTKYLYGTGWVVLRNKTDRLDTGWSSPAFCVQVPADCKQDQWAPEVYKYNGLYYMFTTYQSKKTGRRGTAVFTAEKPTGPFRLASDGAVTPGEWDSIDGSLYLDENGQPWMVFVHEWVSAPEKVGRMAAMKLSDDLTEAISEPVELFRADDPKWAANIVTDGPFLYRTEDGELLMLWSNSDKGGYCIGIARSRSGKPDGKWTQTPQPFYSASLGMPYDGGHGMLFTLNGQKYIVFHSPNSAVGSRSETPVFLPVREENNSLVWDVYRP